MPTTPTDAEKRRRLPWSLAHGAANSVFSQLTFFGPIFVLFLDELGLSKTRPHPRPTAAQVRMLDSSAVDLSPAVTWALGRTGDPGATPALRQALRSDYPLLRSHSARARLVFRETGLRTTSIIGFQLVMSGSVYIFPDDSIPKQISASLPRIQEKHRKFSGPFHGE